MTALRSLRRALSGLVPAGLRPRRFRAAGTVPGSDLQALRAKLDSIGHPGDQARLVKALSSDLRRYYALVPREGDDYWTAIHEGVAALARSMEAGSWRAVPLHHRVMAWLIAEGRREDATIALVDRNENGPSFRVDVQADRLVTHVGYERLIGSPLDAGFMTPAEADLPLVAVLDQARVGRDGALEICGHAYIGNVDFRANHCTLSLSLVSPESDRIPLRAESLVDERIDLESRDRYNSYAHSAFSVVLDAQQLLDIEAGPERTWQLEATVSAGPLDRTGPLRSYDDRGSAGLLPTGFEVDGQAWEAGLDARAGLVLGPRTPGRSPAPSGTIVDSVSVDPGIITLTGHSAAGAELPTRLRLVGDSGELIAHTIGADLVRRTFTAGFSLSQTRFGTAGLAPVPGTYRLVDGDGNAVPASPELVGDFPQTVWTPLVLVEFRRMADDGGLGVTFATPLRDDERGRLNQQKLQARIPALNEEPALVDAVVFACFGGKSVGGSVLALFEQLRKRLPGHVMYWGIVDHSVAVPEGAKAVLLHSREWYEVLHTAKILVNNAHFPYYFRKTPGQFYLQTWHGTPLKRIGDDVPSTTLSSSYRALMKREAGYWDVLLAQNDYAGRVLPSAFGFRGRTLVEGYPHNDVLVDGDETGPGVRAALGIPADKTVVLYAPTWRDDAKNASAGHQLVVYLDFERARQRLGDDVVFLLRGHVNTLRGRGNADADGVIDVTGYPDIAGLYLAADVLVTDYSSVMFDFCVTGKPMVFLAPDLDHYRDSTRGFYIDYAAEMPGPIVGTTDEVTDVILGLPQSVHPYRQRYAAFVLTYAAKDDGRATRRVVEALFPAPVEPTGP